jgi:hypothetical protein
MLAQSFKSSADLGIPESHLSALMKTLVLLETGKLRHVPSSCDGDKAGAFSGQFNMCNWSAESGCGTIACIGGTAELIGDVSFGIIYNSTNSLITDGLRDLFLPPFSGVKWNKITTDQAATALRSYLTTGDARWDLAVQS